MNKALDPRRVKRAQKERIRLGVSYGEIARALGVERSTVSRWFRGETTRISPRDFDEVESFLELIERVDDESIRLGDRETNR